MGTIVIRYHMNMTASNFEKNEAFVDARDLEYINREHDPEKRETVSCAVTTYRRPDKLTVGDAAPPLVLTRITTNEKVTLSAARDRPLVLIFGSYT